MTRHADWLALVQRDGLVLSEPVLADEFPEPFDDLTSYESRQFRQRLERYQRAKRNNDAAGVRGWINYALHDLLGYEREDFQKQATPDWARTYLNEFDQTLRPDWYLSHPDRDARAALLVSIVEPKQPLDKRVEGEGQWRASPTTRLERLLRETDHELGLLTNGDAFRLIYAPIGAPAGRLTFRTQTLADDRTVLRAFRTILGKDCVLSEEPERRLETIARDSQHRQVDVADRLGVQVKEALALLLDAVDQSDRSEDGELLAGMPLDDIYEMHLVVMMRLLFQLYAEERALLPHGDLFFDQAYGLTDLWQRLAEQNRERPDALETTYDAWGRLLASWRLIHRGSTHPDLNLTAYGGRLFDPTRYPVLEHEKLLISNRVVYDVLRRLLFAQPKRGADPQRVSYQELDVEQIGYLYEGLLDHQVSRAHGPVVLLDDPEEGEVPLETLTDTDDLARAIASGSSWSTSDVEGKLERVDPSEQCAEPLRDLDEATRAAIRPFHALVREVVPDGHLYLGLGDSRRKTGTHYTPVSLTERIVRTTLDPLCYTYTDPDDKSQREVKTPEELLELKICDPAMGSGAFLVQVVRYLSERLVEAWEVRLERQGDAPLTMPDAKPSTDPERDRLVPADREEALLEARRFVAERCVYGVDRNPLAVEMAKLSLWLTTLANDKAFSFLDHALKTGDSLVGVTLEQLLGFSLKPEKQKTLFSTGLSETLAQVIEERKKIEATPVLSQDDASRKAEQLDRVNERLALVRTAGDALIAAFFEGESSSDVKRNETMFEKLLGPAAPTPMNPDGDPDALAKVGDRIAKTTQRQHPFHWQIEFPEVFLSNEGFDGVVGNPPFLGGMRISSVQGSRYLDYLKTRNSHASGTADLASYFFYLTYQRLRDGGTMGFLATNTIAQGDTRAAALTPIVEDGGTIYHAVKSMPWPGVAALEVSIAHLVKGDWEGPSVLDGEYVEGITSLLTVGEGVGWAPVPLLENGDTTYVGSYVLGMGFTMSPEVAAEHIERDPCAEDVLFPYLNAQDVNQNPDQTASRWVINFRQWPLERIPESEWQELDQDKREEQSRVGRVQSGYTEPVAGDYPAFIDIVRTLVKPERDLKKRERNRVLWWRYAEDRPGLYGAIADLSYVFTIGQVSKYLAPSKQPTGQVFSHRLYVVASNDPALFCQLQATFHDCWARTFGSTLETRLMYGSTDVYLPYPFLHQERVNLGDLGDLYLATRDGNCVEREIGLTDLYNLFHDPTVSDGDIALLRELHHQLDEATAHAYGWDFDLDHGFYVENEPFSDGAMKALPDDEQSDYLSNARFTIHPVAQRKVIANLVRLNKERHEKELEQGLVEFTKKGNIRITSKGKKWLKKRRQKERNATSKPDEPRDAPLFASSEASS